MMQTAQTTHYLDLAFIVSLLVGTILPVVVGRVTSVTLHPAIKGLVLFVLAAVTGVGGQLLDALNSHTPFLWQAAVLSAVGAAVTAQTAHQAFWRNTPLSNSGSPFGQPAPKPVIDVPPVSVTDTAVDNSDLYTGSTASLAFTGHPIGPGTTTTGNKPPTVDTGPPAT